MPFSGIDSIYRYNKPTLQQHRVYNPKLGGSATSIFFTSNPFMTLKMSGNNIIVNIFNLQLNSGQVKYVYFYISGIPITSANISNYKVIAAADIKTNSLEYAIPLTSLDVDLSNIYVGALFLDHNGNYIKDGSSLYILQSNYKQDAISLPPISLSNFVSNIDCRITPQIKYDTENKKLLGSCSFDITYTSNVFIKYISIDILIREEYFLPLEFTSNNWKNIYFDNFNQDSLIVIDNILVSVNKYYHSFRISFYDSNKNKISILPIDKKSFVSIDGSIITSSNSPSNIGLAHSIYLTNGVQIDDFAILLGYADNEWNFLFSKSINVDSANNGYCECLVDYYYITNYEFYNSSLEEIHMPIDSSTQAFYFGESLVSNINMFPNNNIYTLGSDIEFIKNSGVRVLNYLLYDFEGYENVSFILKTNLNTYCLTRSRAIVDNVMIYNFNFYLNNEYLGSLSSPEYNLNIINDTRFPLIINEDDFFIYPLEYSNEFYQYLFIEPVIISHKKVADYTYYKTFDISYDNKTTMSIADFSQNNISTVSDSELSDDLKSMLRSKQQLQTLTQFTNE